MPGRFFPSLLLPLVLAGCGKPAVKVIIDSNDSISGVLSLGLHIAAPGRNGEPDFHSFPSERTIPPPLTWGLFLPSGTRDTITVTVEADGTGGFVRGCGQEQGDVSPGGTTTIRVLLVHSGGQLCLGGPVDAGRGGPDLGAPLIDLSGTADEGPLMPDLTMVAGGD